MIQVINRAATILNALETHPGGRSLTELAAVVHLPRSTVHRIIKALEDNHLVVPVEAGLGYRLGPAFMRMGVASSSWLASQAHALLVELSAQVDETVDLAVRSGTQVLFIDQVAAPQRLQAVSAVGVAFPLHCTANGKALLALLDDHEIRRLLDRRLRALTPATITSMDDLLADIAQVRRTGVAFDREEHTTGICAVGTIVENVYGIPTALTIPVPTMRFGEREAELTATLLDAAARLTRVLERAIDTSRHQ